MLRQLFTMAELGISGSTEGFLGGCGLFCCAGQ